MIQNNKLTSATFKKTPNSSGNIREFKYIIIHDDYGASVEGTTSWILNPISQVSYHTLIGKEGEIIQYVDFNKRAWHCGRSSWKGLSDLNWYTIGICMQNRGGEDYTEKQIQTAIEVSKKVAEHYSIKEALGHRQIAPTRKTDPNNHFPWGRFNKEVFGIDANVKYTTSNLNLRSGANITHSVIRVLKKGEGVSVLKKSNDWCKVSVISTKETGWVSSKYLK